MQKDFGAASDDIEWVSTAYTLALDQGALLQTGSSLPQLQQVPASRRAAMQSGLSKIKPDCVATRHAPPPGAAGGYLRRRPRPS
jgi:hypothetical protein